MTGKSKTYNRNYNEYIARISPRSHELRSIFRSFWVGGVICCIGQGFRYLLEFGLGLTGDELAAYVSVIMIFLGAFLTGLGVYDRIGKYAGDRLCRSPVLQIPSYLLRWNLNQRDLFTDWRQKCSSLRGRSSYSAWRAASRSD